MRLDCAVSFAIRVQDRIADGFRYGQLDRRHIDRSALQRPADRMACVSAAHRLRRQIQVELTLGSDPSHPAISATRSATGLRAPSPSATLVAPERRLEGPRVL